MNFKIAKRELSRLAKGKYYSLSYGMSVYNKSCGGFVEPKVECSVYIDGVTHLSAPTWREALALMRKKIDIRVVEVDLNEAPCEEKPIRQKSKRKRALQRPTTTLSHA